VICASTSQREQGIRVDPQTAGIGGSIRHKQYSTECVAAANRRYRLGRTHSRLPSPREWERIRCGRDNGLCEPGHALYFLLRALLLTAE